MHILLEYIILHLFTFGYLLCIKEIRKNYIKLEYLDIETRVGPGDHILFPANYMATHSITEIHEGTRYSYISTFGQGTSAPDRGIVIQTNRESGMQGRSWLPNLEKDFIAEVGPDHRFAPRARDHKD